MQVSDRANAALACGDSRADDEAALVYMSGGYDDVWYGDPILLVAEICKLRAGDLMRLCLGLKPRPSAVDGVWSLALDLSAWLAELGYHIHPRDIIEMAHAEAKELLS